MMAARKKGKKTQGNLAEISSEEASRSRYFDSFYWAPVGYLMLTEQGLIMEANPVFAALVGVAIEALRGQPLSRFVFQVDQEKYCIYNNQLVENCQMQTCELRYVKADGRQFWIQMEANALQDSDGAKLIQAVVIDITSRKQAEQAIQHNAGIQSVLREIAEAALLSSSLDELYRSVHLLVGRFLPAENFNIAILNEALGHMEAVYCADETGVIPQRRPVGSYMTEYVMRLQRAVQLTSAEFERLQEAGEVVARFVPFKEWMGAPLKDAQGKVFGVVTLLSFSEEPLFRHGDIEVLSIIAAQVSLAIERKQAETALNESEKRFRALVRDVNVIIYITNVFGRITFMNEYGLSFYGYSEEELIGKTELETILPEYESTGRNLKKISEEFKATAQLHQRCTLENITKSRRRVWVDFTNRYAENVETGETGWICVGVDVTASKRAEQAQLRLYTRRRVWETLNETINRRISHAEMLSELKQSGMVLDSPFVVSLLKVPAEYLLEAASDKDRMERQHRIDLLIDFLHGSKAGIACQTPAGLVVIQPLYSERNRPVTASLAKLAVNELLKKMSGYWFEKEALVGVCHSTDALQDAATLFEQARAALQYGPTLAPGNTIYHWNDLGCFQFIVKDLHSEQVQQFIRNNLGPLLSRTVRKTWKRSKPLSPGAHFR